MLRLNPGLDGTTIFKHLQRKYPGKHSDGQLRTLQRRIKQWRALEGPGKEVFFSQEHHPGEKAQFDFTHMSGLGITINGEPFDHMIYHFVQLYILEQRCRRFRFKDAGDSGIMFTTFWGISRIAGNFHRNTQGR